jgi:hypothetical protein
MSDGRFDLFSLATARKNSTTQNLREMHQEYSSSSAFTLCLLILYCTVGLII